MNIYFDCNDEYLLINGRPHTGGAITCLEGGVIDICHCGRQEYAIPLMTRLKLAGGALSKCNNISVTYWDRDTLSIAFLPKLCMPYSQPQPIAMHCAKVRGKAHNLTVYSQCGYYISIETCDEIYTRPLPPDFCAEGVSATLHVCEERNCTILIAVIKGGEKDYMLALNYTDDYYPIAFACADKIDVDKCEIFLTDNIRDMCRLAVCRRYLIENGEIRDIGREFVYRDDCIDYAPQLLPYAYCESVIIGDIGRCDVMCSCTDKSHLFKGCKRICEPPHRRLRPYEIALLRPCKGGNNAQYYEFNIKDGLISGINRCR
ncbi:MAG: hypothetical protein K2I79_03990 [Clostridia bacterium]|nr:hypothetical protein [Clostridia bacterium]